MKRSRLDTAVSIAEIISSAAIVVSLIYVAYEFQRSESLTNRDVENIIYERMLQLDHLLIGNKDLAGLIIKAENNQNDLTPEEEMRYLAYEHIFYDSWESAWYYHQEKILEDKNWEGWNSWFISAIENKPLLSWEGNRKNYNGGFLEYLDEVFKNHRK